MSEERFRTLVRGVIRSALGTNDVGEFARLRRLALERRFYRREITLAQLREILIYLGFSSGRTVWVQSSWNEFYNLRGKPSEVLSLMRDLLGPEGTLVMPAFPLNPNPNNILEIDAVPSSAGLLTELFRRDRSAKRSIHLSSSVCAVGPLAEFLTKDHHLDLFAWGRQTPYCRLVDVDARFVALGAKSLTQYVTPLHSVECLLYDQMPFFRRVFDGVVKYKWRRRAGETGSGEFLQRTGRLDTTRFSRRFPTEIYVNAKVSNLNSYGTDAKALIGHALDLGRSGVNWYIERSVGPAKTD